MAQAIGHIADAEVQSGFTVTSDNAIQFAAPEDLGLHDPAVACGVDDTAVCAGGARRRAG